MENGQHEDKPRNPSWFKKGREKTGGKQPGTQSKITRTLKECILMAAELEGSDGNGKDEITGFLRRLIKEDIRAFAALLGRVLPMTHEGRTDVRVEVVYDSLDDVRRELAARGITMDAVKELLRIAPEKIIEHDEPIKVED